MSDETQVTQQSLPLLPLIQGVIFPHTLTTIPVGRDKSVALVQSLKPGQHVYVGVQRTPDVSDPDQLTQLYTTATLARVQQLVRLAHGGYRIVLQGLERAKLTSMDQTEPYWMVTAEATPQQNQNTAHTRQLVQELRTKINEIMANAGPSLERILRQIQDPAELADRVSAELGLDTAQRAILLETLDVEARLERLINHLDEMVTRSEVKKTIEDNVRQNLNNNQREAILREQLRAIRKELGDDPEDETDQWRQRLDEANLPAEVREVAEREYRRMQNINPGQAEYNVIRNYLEWIVELPWLDQTDAEIDIDAIEHHLATGHFGLNDAKKHILEHMAVLKLSNNSRGTILCLAGPPGVGKTSLAQSVADAIDRPLVRISLGGVRDEAEIRGHRRTYIGAMPGRLISALRKAKVNNPVVVLDEIDKLGQGWMGSPEAALLEVLDPEQNTSFTDHYMELPFDLSNAMFICTANDLQNISAPLRDRLDIINISGYTPHEKTQIGQHHVWHNLLVEHGLEALDITISDEAISSIVMDYTREAGVRQLKRQLTKIVRGLTLEVAKLSDEEKQNLSMTIQRADLDRFLGKAIFFNEVALRTAMPGVATGLAWTPVGGDILFIESTRMPGKGRVETTGQLGDVMKESARAALSYLRTHAEQLGISPDFLETHDVHIHIPAGGIPKDGPSAGVTMFTALTSLLTGRTVRHDTAMTGECSLRGQVLPVGGIKSKVLAAHRAGIKRVILPDRNARDLDDVPKSALEDMEIILVNDMSQVLEAALNPETSPTPTTEDTAHPSTLA